MSSFAIWTDGCPGADVMVKSGSLASDRSNAVAIANARI